MDYVKPTLPTTENLDFLAYEIHDESNCQDDTLVWLIAEEELPVLGHVAESCESLSAAPQDACGAEPVALVSAVGEEADVQLLTPGSLERGDCVGIANASSPLTYRVSAQFSQTRWLFRVAALVSILLIGSMLPPILEHLEHIRSARLKSSVALASSSARSQSAGRARSEPVRVLTVMVGREETIEGISLRYVGHFDQDLFEEIRNLNPDLKDPGQLEDGQLIKIPLRPRID
jgi:hypothetical protein